ncbi:hypothetical protein JCM6882_002839 [Rhodosporidiobolus microsporus]
MPRPSAADMLAFQLEQASSNRAAQSPMSAPPSSSFGSPPSTAPSTPGTPWTPPPHESYQPLNGAARKGSMPAAMGRGGAGLGIEADGTSFSRPVAEQVPRAKLAGRGATRTMKAEEEEEEETDDELEDELNDFGYGARPRRRKEKKESLLDILNSEPPEWMNRPPSPVEEVAPVSNHTRSSTFSQKLRSRFTSSTSSTSSEDPQAAFSTLRTSRSAGNLLGLGSLRKNSTSTTAAHQQQQQNGAYSFSSKRSVNHSKDNLSLSGSTSTSHLPSFQSPSLSGFNSETYPPFSTSTVDEFGRAPPSYLSPLPPSQPLPKLSAKEASSAASESTRALADFLRSSAPPGETAYPSYGRNNGAGSQREREDSSTSLHASNNGRNRSRSTLHKTRRSQGGGGGGSGTREGSPDRERDSIDTYTTSGTAAATSTANANIIKAAMVKLGGAGRRASLTAFSPGMFSSSSNGANGAVGPAPPSPAATQESEDGTGDIRVDAALLDGLFGVVPSSAAAHSHSASGKAAGLQRSLSARRDGSSASTAANGLSEHAARRARPSEPPSTGSAAAAVMLGVREFVEQDEKHAHAQHAGGRGLPTVSRAGELSGTGLPAPAPFRVPPPRSSSVTAVGGGLERSGSVRSEASMGLASPTSPSRVTPPHKLSRKPVPAAIPPVEELLNASSASTNSSSRSSPASASPARRPAVREETLAALMRLQERGDTSPFAVGESPIKGAPSRHHPNGPSSLAAPLTPTTATSAPATPTSPIPSVYSTPPLTPIPGSTSFAAAPSHSTTKASKRLSLAGTTDPRPISPPPETPLPAPPPAAAVSAVLIQPATPSQSLSRAARRLSTVPASPPAKHQQEQNGASESVDSFVDPPLTATLPTQFGEDGESSEEEEQPYAVTTVATVVDEPVLLALEALRQSMSAAAAFPFPHISPTEEHPNDRELVAALLPTLKAMKQQMELGAALIGAVLERVEGRGVEVDIGAELRAEEEGRGVAGVAEVLLADGEGDGREAAEETPEGREQENAPYPVRVVADKAPTVDFHRLSTLDAGQGFSGFVQALSM